MKNSNALFVGEGFSPGGEKKLLQQTGAWNYCSCSTEGQLAAAELFCTLEEGWYSSKPVGLLVYSSGFTAVGAAAVGLFL